LLLDIERIEAGAQHEHELVAQHLTGGAQLALIAMTLTQQARLAVGAAVAEGREYQRDQREPIEIWHEIVEVAVVRPDHADLTAALEQRLGIFEKARGGDQHRTIAWKLGAVGSMEENIGCDFSVLNEWHRPAP